MSQPLPIISDIPECDWTETIESAADWRIERHVALRRDTLSVSLQRNPDSRAARFEHAILALQDADFETTVERFTAVIADKPEARAYEWRAHADLRQKQYQLSIDDLTGAIELDADNVALYAQRADAFTDWYKSSQQKSLLDRAIADDDAAMERSARRRSLVGGP